MKSATSVPLQAEIPKKASLLQEIKTIYHYHQRSTREIAIHDYTNVYRKTMRDLGAFGLDSIAGKEVLDIGCGARFPFSLLAAAEGAHITALDVMYLKPHPLPLFFWKILRANGVKRAAKSAVRKALFDELYFKQLEESAGIDLTPFVSKINFVLADPQAANYPIAANKYDLIVSNAVLEHVYDVEKYFREVSRVLIKGGLSYGLVHNYYSISGGHNLEWAFPDSKPSAGAQPWDHLRGDEFPTHTYLNKLRPEEYKAAAAASLEVLLFESRDINHNAGGLEGEKFLTSEVQAELSEYPRELLLARSFCIICRKR